MTYKRSVTPIDDLTPSINIIRRPRRARRRRGLGDATEDFLINLVNQTAAAGQEISSAAGQAADAGSDITGATGPQNFVNKGGICKPADRATLDAVADFQKQLNRVAEVKGFVKIAIDGDLGPATLTSFRQAQGNSGFSVIGDASSCVTLGANLSVASASVRAFADRIGAPSASSVSQPRPLTTPSFVNPSTGAETKVSAPGTGSITDVVRSMTTPMKLALGGMAVGIGYFLFVDKKKRQRR